jgi:hypothetical protein
MPQVVIENPILNSPYDEPRMHCRFSEEGITDEIEWRSPSPCGKGRVAQCTGH